VFVAREGTHVKKKIKANKLISFRAAVCAAAVTPEYGSNNSKSTQQSSTQKAEGLSGVLAQVAISKRVKCKLMLDDC